MIELVNFRVTAHSSSGLLCKILGLFAQLGLPAPILQVSLVGVSMRIELSLANFGDARAQIVARKISGFVGVESVTVI
ncbi:hypothetical protein [Altererythrobacter sp. Root672]|uniref:hypothetical protein n=1 Tax=Altererythrobacter sp. Root672 TaxID=1736584 RepID=UPI0006F31BF7|nr:hypothetical protein [Altererythrobacter sp. Root672]KRA82655.1 hypothetical protein ASD76_00725 [Altererythrobacter sp. Root672]